MPQDTEDMRDAAERVLADAVLAVSVIFQSLIKVGDDGRGYLDLPEEVRTVTPYRTGGDGCWGPGMTGVVLKPGLYSLADVEADGVEIPHGDMRGTVVLYESADAAGGVGILGLNSALLGVVLAHLPDAEAREYLICTMHDAAAMPRPSAEDAAAMASGTWVPTVTGRPCDAAGAEPEDAKRAPRTYATKVKCIEALIDPVSRAATGRGKTSLTPMMYWASDCRLDVPTGNGGTVGLMVQARNDLDMTTAEPPDYMLNGADGYWLDLVSSLFYAGDNTREVTGSQILMLAGYSNPYQESAWSVMADAARSIEKMMRTTVTIDTTTEARRKNRKRGEIMESTTIQPLANVHLSLEKIKTPDGDVVRDFTVTMAAATPDDAFPFASYARSREMITRIGQSEYKFKGLRPSLDARMAYHNILKRVHQETCSNTVKLNTMWRDLGLKEPNVSATKRDGTPKTAAEMEKAREDAVRKQHDRIIKQLEKMLDEAVKTGQLARWEWTKDKSGRPDGFKITPIKKNSAETKKCQNGE